MLEIKTKLSTAFHPQTDRQTEQMNQELSIFTIGFLNLRVNKGNKDL